MTLAIRAGKRLPLHFNPHEREARDHFRRKTVDNTVYILIHTSVKLVTSAAGPGTRHKANFNPHEREARDEHVQANAGRERYFNPHEREARDAGYLQRRDELPHFNPHEREARDPR